IGAFNAVARYLGRFTGTNLSSNAYIEMQWYLFSIVFLAAGAWALQQDAHVRVDVLFGRLSPKRQALVNLVGTLIFLLPFCVLMIWVSWSYVENSWSIREVSPDPGGLPRYPIKFLIPFAFVLMLLQAISQAIKHAAEAFGLASETAEAA
ncbi:MAG: TRAP transporter small permease subunit, partial [Bacteroidota bacterium]